MPPFGITGLQWLSKFFLIPVLAMVFKASPSRHLGDKALAGSKDVLDA
jgi:hypothetical protein